MCDSPRAQLWFVWSGFRWVLFSFFNGMRSLQESSHMIQSHRVSDQAQLVPKSYCISLAQRGQGDPYTVRRSALACPHAAASTREKF